MGTEANWHGLAYFCVSKYCWTTKQHGLHRLPIGNSPSNALITEPSIGMVGECPKCILQARCTQKCPTIKDPPHVPLTSSQLTSTV